MIPLLSHSVQFTSGTIHVASFRVELTRLPLADALKLHVTCRKRSTMLHIMLSYANKCGSASKDSQSMPLNNTV